MSIYLSVDLVYLDYYLFLRSFFKQPLSQKSAPIPIMPTPIVSDRFETLRLNIINLLDLKKAVDRHEQELKVLEARKRMIEADRGSSSSSSSSSSSTGGVGGGKGGVGGGAEGDEPGQSFVISLPSIAVAGGVGDLKKVIVFGVSGSFIPFH